MEETRLVAVFHFDLTTLWYSVGLEMALKTALSAQPDEVETCRY